jgi:hypothetical protein
MTEGPAEAPPVYLDARRELSARYLFGEGVEIGPLHLPLAMPPGVKVSYVDRLKVADSEGTIRAATHETCRPRLTPARGEASCRRCAAADREC